MNLKNWSLQIWALIAILTLIGSIGAIYVYGTYFDPTKILTGGTVETSIPLLLADPSIIDWGTITVYGQTAKTVTLTNNGTEIIYDMIFETSNWQNTSNLNLILDWNYTGTNIIAEASLPIQFTLKSTAPPQTNTTETITHFSFDILITPITG